MSRPAFSSSGTEASWPRGSRAYSIAIPSFMAWKLAARGRGTATGVKTGTRSGLAVGRRRLESEHARVRMGHGPVPGVGADPATAHSGPPGHPGGGPVVGPHDRPDPGDSCLRCMPEGGAGRLDGVAVSPRFGVEVPADLDLVAAREVFQSHGSHR